MSATPAPLIIERPSPNFGPRRGRATPRLVVLHYTAMAADGALRRLSDPAAEVSAHYLIDADGTTFGLVDEAMRAWHAGRGGWSDTGDVNSWSVGIELANPGHHLGYPPYPEAQTGALEALLAGVLGRWKIPPEGVIGHACMAPGRKQDPGEKLDWRRLARRGLAVWRDPPLVPGTGRADAASVRAAARRFGYPVASGGGWDDGLDAFWQSFAMRFLAGSPLFARPPCAAGAKHLAALAARWPAARPIGA